MAADGSKVDANVEVRATAADCVAMSRHNLTKLKALKGGETDEFLLEQFVTVNWATIEESTTTDSRPWWRRLLAWLRGGGNKEQT
jgi:hypothetical protein